MSSDDAELVIEGNKPDADNQSLQGQPEENDHQQLASSTQEPPQTQVDLTQPNLPAPQQITEEALQRYWCHQCRRAVSLRPSHQQCPHCHDSFVEEMDADQEDNLQEWAPPENAHDELSAFLQAIGAASGTLVVSRTGGGPRQVITFRRGGGGAPPPMGLNPLAQRTPMVPPGPDGSVQSFNQLMMLLMQMMQAPSGDPNLDTIIARIMESDPNRWGPPPASATAVASLGKITIDQEHIDKETDCAVCMEAFVLADTASKMPCEHLFHEACLQSWLDHHNSCPVCRHELPTDDSDYERIRLRRLEERQQAQEAAAANAASSSSHQHPSTDHGGRRNSRSSTGPHSHSIRNLLSRFSRRRASRDE